MKRHLLVLAGLIFFTAMYAEQALTIYAEEFNALKEHPDYRLIFDAKRHTMLRYIDAELKNYPQLSAGSKFLYRSLFAMGTVVVNNTHMPKLHAYVQDMCQNADMPMPIVVVTFLPGYNSAAATKMLLNDGVIIIGSDLLLDPENSEEMIEAVLAHELGHIKHNHINKKWALSAIVSVAVGATLYFKTKDKIEWFRNEGMARLFFAASMGIAGYASQFIINKKFEKEADEFAVKKMNKGKGLIKYFTRLDQERAELEDDFKETYARLRANKHTITSEDFNFLNQNYTSSWWGHQWNKMWYWLDHHTPLGDHPSNELRIKAAQDYLNERNVQQ